MQERMMTTDDGRRFAAHLNRIHLRLGAIAILLLAMASGVACIADKALVEGDPCPGEPADGRVCSGNWYCGYGIYNACPAAPYETVCTCIEGAMLCDPLAGQKVCEAADVPQDTIGGDTPETDAETGAETLTGSE